LKNGVVYRGHLMNVEDNMNSLLEGVTVTMKDGKINNLEQVYLRGSQIVFFIMPDMLKHAPMFKPPSKNRGKGGLIPGKGGKGFGGKGKGKGKGKGRF